MDLDLGDNELVEWLVLLVHRLFLDQVQRLKAINQMAKDGKFLIERRVLPVSDEKLGPVAIGSKVSHAQHTSLVMPIFFGDLVFEGRAIYAFAPSACSSRVPSLDNKATYVLMQLGTDIVLGGAETEEVSTRLRCRLAI